MNVARPIDLPENLFSTDEEEEPVTAIRETPEFLALVAEVDQKKERRKKKSKTFAASMFNRTLAEVDVMMSTHDWSFANARHLVALYDRMHTKVYGVECAELGPAERYNTIMQANTLVKVEFDGDFEDAVDYMRWVWMREMNKEKWVRETGAQGGRITPWLMFSKKFLTDYRLAMARRSNKR